MCSKPHSTIELPRELLPQCHQKALEARSCLTEWEATIVRAGFRASAYFADRSAVPLGTSTKATQKARASMIVLASTNSRSLVAQPSARMGTS